MKLHPAALKLQAAKVVLPKLLHPRRKSKSKIKAETRKKDPAESTADLNLELGARVVPPGLTHGTHDEGVLHGLAQPCKHVEGLAQLRVGLGLELHRVRPRTLRVYQGQIQDPAGGANKPSIRGRYRTLGGGEGANKPSEAGMAPWGGGGENKTK